MNLSKLNVVQALGCIIAVVFYLVGPVIGISLLPVGLRGTIVMRIDFIFVLPIILMGLALVLSIAPIGPLSSIGGFVAGIATLIIGLCSGDVVVGFVKKVGSLAATQIPEISSLNVGIDALSILMSIGWGALAASLILIFASIIGAVVMGIMGKSNGGNGISGGYGGGRTSQVQNGSASYGGSHRAGQSNLYRR